jgi:hypothetical protein
VKPVVDLDDERRHDEILARAFDGGNAALMLGIGGVEQRDDRTSDAGATGRALKARTYGDLDPLIGDLPGRSRAPGHANDSPWTSNGVNSPTVGATR